MHAAPDRWHQVTAVHAFFIPSSGVSPSAHGLWAPMQFCLQKGTMTVIRVLGRNPRLPVHSHSLDSLTVHREEAQNTFWLLGSQELCC